MRRVQLLVCASAALMAATAFAATIPTFRAHTLQNPVFSPSFAVTDDFDNDGDPDVIVITKFGPISWYETDNSTTPPTFRLRTIVDAADVDNPTSAYPIDFDGDGLKDLVVAQRDVGEALLFKADVSTGALLFEKSTLVTEISGSIQVLPVDLDSDGDIDLVFNQFGLVDFGWYENMGGSPPQFERRILVNGLFNRAVVINAADMDGDGDIDIIAGSSSTGARCNPFINTASIYVNDGNIPANFTEFRIFDTTCIVTPLIGDLDLDGDLDLVGVSEIVDIFKNTGDGVSTVTFSQIPLVTTTQAVEGVALDGALGDLNGDGSLDILLDLKIPIPVNPNEDPRFAAVAYLNVVNSFPDFREFLFPGLFMDPSQIEAADFDLDGDVDVFILSDPDNTGAFIENRLITCPGNCNGDDVIDFNDLVCLLFQFGDDSPTGSLDCDNNGIIDFNDLLCTLFIFGDCDG